jgi:hypothetical protein
VSPYLEGRSKHPGVLNRNFEVFVFVFVLIILHSLYLEYDRTLTPSVPGASRLDGLLLRNFEVLTKTLRLKVRKLEKL